MPRAGSRRTRYTCTSESSDLGVRAYFERPDAICASALTSAVVISPDARRSAGGVPSPKRSGCKSRTNLRSATRASRPLAPSGRSRSACAEARLRSSALSEQQWIGATGLGRGTAQQLEHPDKPIPGQPATRQDGQLLGRHTPPKPEQDGGLLGPQLGPTDEGLASLGEVVGRVSELRSPCRFSARLRASLEARGRSQARARRASSSPARRPTARGATGARSICRSRTPARAPACANWQPDGRSGRRPVSPNRTKSWHDVLDSRRARCRWRSFGRDQPRRGKPSWRWEALALDPDKRSPGHGPVFSVTRRSEGRRAVRPARFESGQSARTPMWARLRTVAQPRLVCSRAAALPPRSRTRAPQPRPRAW